MAPTTPLIVSLTHNVLHVHSVDGNPLKVPDPLSLPTTITAYPNSSRLVEGTSAGTLVLRDTRNLQPTFTLTCAVPSKITAVAVSQTAHLLAAGHKDGSVTLYNPSSPAHLATFNESSPILAVAFAPISDPRHLAVVTALCVTLYSPTTYRKHARLVLPSPPARSYVRSPVSAAKLTAVAFSPFQPSLLAATDDTGCLTVWDIAKHLVSRARTNPSLTEPAPHARFVPTLRAPAAALSFMSDGILLVAGFDKQVRVFDPSLTRTLFTTPAPAPVSAMATHATRVALGLTDGSVALAGLDTAANSLVVHRRIRIPVPDSAPSIAVRSVFLPLSRPPLAERRRDRIGRRDLERPPARSPDRRPPRPVVPPISPPKLPDLSATTNLLESLDDVLARYSAGERDSAAADADLFSPVSKRTPPSTSSPLPPLSLRTRGLSESVSLYELPASTPGKPRRSLTTDDVAASARGERVQQGNGSGQQDRLHEEGRASADSSFSLSRSGTAENIRRGQRVPRHSDDDLDLQESTVTDDNAAASGGSERADSLRSATPLSGSFLESSMQKDVELQPDSRVDIDDVSRVIRASARRPLTLESDSDGRSKHTLRFNLSQDRLPGDSTDSFVMPKQVPQGRKRQIGLESVEGQLGLNQLAGADNTRSPTRIGSVDGEKKEEMMSGVSGMLKDIVKTAMDELRTDLRSDILAIHSEMVMMEARRSEELRSVVLERDVTMARLRDEVTRLRGDNERLRRKYGLR